MVSYLVNLWCNPISDLLPKVYLAPCLAGSPGQKQVGVSQTMPKIQILGRKNIETSIDLRKTKVTYI